MKRFIDLAVSAVLAVLSFPLLFTIAIIVKWKLGSPVLFKQTRVGYREQLFTIYKFRTMRDTRDSKGRLLSDDQRLIKLGRFLRASSLDELPELFNVIRGEMSLVGPRPLLIQYLQRYTPEQRRRHNAKPGITGWAQVNGRNAITWEVKFALDVWYVDHQSLWLDAKIIVLTLWKVLRREGISQAGRSTVDEFTGNSTDA
jgi:sugar transferase EpsL